MPPDQLVMLVGELLDDHDRKQPRGSPTHGAPSAHSECPNCSHFPESTVDEDREDLHRAHDILRPRIEALISGVNIVGYPGFDKAAEFEAASPEDSEGHQPSSASVASVAAAANASRDSVRRWRQMASYRHRVTFLRRQMAE
jgi:hypothetical protein